MLFLSLAFIGSGVNPPVLKAAAPRVRATRVIPFGEITHASLAPSSDARATQENGPSVVTAVALTPDSKLMAAVGDDHLVRVWETKTGKLKYRFEGHSDWVRSAVFTQNGNSLVSVGNDRTICIWNMKDGLCKNKISSFSHVLCTLVPNPNNPAEVIAAGFIPTLFKINSQTGIFSKPVLCPCKDIRSVTYDPTGKWLAAAGRNGIIRIWENGKTTRDIKASKRRIRALAFSPDGKYLASAGEDGLVRIWNYQTGIELFSLPSQMAKIFTIIFTSPNQIAAGGTDNRIQIWNLDSKSVEKVLVGHTGSVTSLAVDATKKTLISGSYDTTIRIWKLQKNRSDTALIKPTTVVR